MPDKNEYYEFLYAYTLGCLDEDDLINLKQYLSSSDDFYWQELGDFQNLSALLPSILSVEKPEPEVKDRVARKLYRIRNEIKAKRDKLKGVKAGPKVSKEKVETNVEEIAEPVKESVSEEEHKEILNEENKQNVEEFEVVSTPSKSVETTTTSEDEKTEMTKEKEQVKDEQVLNFNARPESATEDEIDTTSEEPEGPSLKSTENKETKAFPDKRRKARYERLEYIEKKETKKSGVLFVITTILMFLLAAVFAYMYFNISTNVKGYEAQIISLNQELSNLKQQVRQNIDLRAVLSSKNLKTVNLAGSGIAANASGKLFIDLDTNHGIVELSNFPQLHGEGTYQLWIFIYDNYLSLGKFSPTEESAFFSFDTPQLSLDSNVNFLVTEESSGGSLQPGDKVFLKGSF